MLFCIGCIEEEKKRENKLLYLAETDLMTGLCNRGSGEKKITAFLKERTAGLLCLLDCDKFKSINDTYGHSVGDKVIIAIAEKLQKSCRDKDVIFRLGGDEFAMFMTLGACFYDGDENVSFDELYRNADSAMYQSKKKQGYSYTIYDGQ